MLSPDSLLLNLHNTISQKPLKALTSELDYQVPGSSLASTQMYLACMEDAWMRGNYVTGKHKSPPEKKKKKAMTQNPRGCSRERQLNFIDDL